MRPGHGTRACYLRGCRRPECSQAHYRYMSRWRLDNERDQRRRVPAATAATHVRTLLEEGWSLTQIQDASGVGRHTIRDISTGHQEWMRPESETQLLALPIGPAPAPRDIDGTGTRRRIQALVAIGHTLTGIAAEVGISQYALARIARAEQKVVRRVTAESTARVYRTRALTPGPSPRSRTMARTRGWHSPLAWDEDTIDDPTASPDVGDPGGTSTARGVELMAEEVRHLDGFGLSDDVIARQLSRSVDYVGWVRRTRLRPAA